MKQNTYEKDKKRKTKKFGHRNKIRKNLKLNKGRMRNQLTS